MDSQWSLKAPQWQDFESSPQPFNDDFFSYIHEELETPAVCKPAPAPQLIKEKAPQSPTKKSKNINLAPPENESEYGIKLEVIKSTPIKVKSPKSRKSELSFKETTIDDVLCQAMKDLQLSIKRNARSQRFSSTPSKLPKTPLRLSQSIRNQPGNNKCSSMKKQMMQFLRNTPIDSVSPKISDTPQSSKLDKSALGDESNAEHGTSKTPTSSLKSRSVENVQSAMETSSKPEEPSNSENIEESDEIPQNFVVKFDKRCSNISGKLPRDLQTFRQPRFSTFQYRRRSLAKYRRRSNKFISMAEAVRKFQNGTPKRFRSISNKDPKPGPLARVKQSQLRVTQPISPALRSKNRTRPVTVLSREEQEKLELEEIQKHPIKANPVRVSTLKGPAPLKKVEKKPLTVPQPFHLTEVKKSSHSSTQSLDDNSAGKASRAPRKKKFTVPIIVNTETGLVLEQTEILDFGIPDVSHMKKSTTKTVPFSFEERNLELQKRKEQKIKQLLTEEEQKLKVPFHAKPVPSFKKPAVAAAKEPTEAKTKTQPCPFSFEEREKSRPNKKAEFIQNILEEDRKARMFHAQPVPEIKPVLVRGLSKENVSTGDKATANQKGRMSILPVSKTGSKSNLVPKKENRNPASVVNAAGNSDRKSNNGAIKKEVIPKIKKVLTEVHLNTEKRAKERREFDEKIRQKEEEIEMLQKKSMEERLAREEAEKAEIRRMAEIKARPMPIYKPPAIIKSDKALTQPQSPAWAAKSKHQNLN